MFKCNTVERAADLAGRDREIASAAVLSHEGLDKKTERNRGSTINAL